MKIISNLIFILILLLSVAFGFVILKSRAPAQKYLPAAENPGKCKIEAAMISNVTANTPKVMEICFFETRKDVGNWTSRRVRSRLSADHASQGKYSMEISWDKRHSYNIYYCQFSKDWGNYRSFIFDVYNGLNTTSGVSIGIFDDFDMQNFLRPVGGAFLKRYELKPGWNTLKADINEIQKTVNIDSGRRLIRLSFSELNAAYYVDNMRLER